MVRQGVKKMQRVSHYKGKQQDSPNLADIWLNGGCFIRFGSSEKFEKTSEGYYYGPLNFINKSCFSLFFFILKIIYILISWKYDEYCRFVEGAWSTNLKQVKSYLLCF